MGVMTGLRDSLLNLITGLGSDKDPMSGLTYTIKVLGPDQLENAYRSDWVARKVIHAPAEDATRAWRTWQAADGPKDDVEDTEKQFNVQEKVKQALIKARLYGGAALVMGVEQGTEQDELDFDTLGKDCLTFLHVMSQYELTAGPREDDIRSQWFGRPRYYTIGGAPITNLVNKKGMSTGVQIHPSRVIEFVGNELPDSKRSQGNLWGDSVLQSVDDAVRGVGLVSQGIAGMISDAKLDIVNIPGLSGILSDPEQSKLLLQRFGMANQMKSMVNTLLLDENEKWQRIGTSFAALPDILKMYLIIAAGAASIPVTRLVGQLTGSMGGGGAAGDSDVRNYYDDISSNQETVIGPRMVPLDEVLVITSTGARDETIYYEWKPLWEMSDIEKADIAAKKADTTGKILNTGLFSEDVLRNAYANQIDEDGVYPGWKDAVEEAGGLEPPAPEGHFDPQTGQPLPGTPAAAAVAAMNNKQIPGQKPNGQSNGKFDGVDDEGGNPYHDPENGQFTSGEAGGLSPGDKYIQSDPITKNPGLNPRTGKPDIYTVASVNETHQNRILIGHAGGTNNTMHKNDPVHVQQKMDMKVVASAMKSFNRGGNAADNLREHDVQDLMQRYGTNERTAKEIYNRISRATGSKTRDAFDPNEERDDHGRWSAGGGAMNSHQVAMHGVLTNAGWQHATHGDLKTNAAARHEGRGEQFDKSAQLYVHPGRPHEAVKTQSWDPKKGYSNWSHSVTLHPQKSTPGNHFIEFQGGIQGQSGKGAAELQQHLKKNKLKSR